MGEYTLNTDFSSLSGSQAGDWLSDFSKLAETAFEGRDDRARLLGNLLVIEQYVHTLRQGLAESGEQPSAILQRALDLLWDWLEGRVAPEDLQDFANNLYASVLSYNVGESLTDTQEEFDKEHFGGLDLNGCEWQIIGWIAVLLMELVAVAGGRLDFDEFERCKQVDFGGLGEFLDVLYDPCIEFTGTPLPSSTAKDLLKAIERVYQTPMFRKIVSQIQKSLNTALEAVPEQFPALREEYRQYGIFPEEFAADLMEF